jgi:PAS domain S-box-containing protein
MKARSKLAWKLSVVVVAILTAAIALSGYVNNWICAHYTLESARASLRFNTESIIKGIGQLMMSRDVDGIQTLIADVSRSSSGGTVSRDSTVYRDIRLVSHLEDRQGEVAVSRSGKSEKQVMAKEDRRCAVCHTEQDGDGVDKGTVDMVIGQPNGERVLSVMAPIRYEARCAKCHEDIGNKTSPEGQIMGFLSADYSLQQVDAMATGRWMRITLTFFASLALGMVALRVMFTRLLEKPIADLIAGTERIAAHKLDFRFDQNRDDEIGVLEKSFNTMTARIEAHRDELRSVMEYLGGIVENSADMIITVSPGGFIETFNRGAEKTLGYDRVEVIGERVEILFADPRERDVAIERLKHTDNVTNYEARFLTKEGQVRDVLLTLSRLRDREGNPIGTFGISKDVTQEKKLLDELRDAKQYLEGMVENSADMIITTNSEGLIETFNRGGEELLGYRRHEVIGKHIESLYVDPSERRAAAAILKSTGNVSNYETRLRAKDGQVRSILLTLSPLRDGEGRAIGTIGISKDIAQEKELQDELRQAKEYLEGMVENSADMIITTNSEGLIETFNRGGEELLGYGREEVIGEHIESLYVDPSERQAAAATLQRTGNVANLETRLRAKDGQVRNILLTLSPLRDTHGQAIGTIGISKDITREKQLQRELVQSQKFAAIGQAVTGIQHAIKNMLNSLTGGSYLVRIGMNKSNQERIKEGWAMIEEGIERITDLSRSMLYYAKDWKLNLQQASVNDLVENVCELNRQTAADQGVALRSEVNSGLPDILCDPKLIHMATTDLVVNAIDACVWKDYGSGESAEIVLKNSLTEDGNYFVIEVRDNGCGMNEETRRNIFTPFFSTKKTRGTGLGLAMTARIINVHGGEINVESEPDRGTKFRVYLPIGGPRE